MAASRGGVYDDFSLLFQDAFLSGDPDFHSSAEGEDEATRARSLMTRLPERFDYAPADRIDFPFVTATFRGDDGTADLYVPLGVPVARDEGGRRRCVPGRSSSGTTTRLPKKRGQRTGGYPRRMRPHAVETFRLRASPGPYELAVEFEKGRGGVGFARSALAVPDYAPGTFAMSDVLLARGVEEADGRGFAAGDGLILRRGFAIAPAPARTFAAQQPVYVYVEGYGLALADGRSRYALAVRLTPEATATGLAGLAQRLFGRDERGVGIEFEGEASGADFGEYVVVDASTQPPGPYLLTLRLRDLISGRTLERTTPVFIE